jgi:hypothetical protein
MIQRRTAFVGDELYFHYISNSAVVVALENVNFCTKKALRSSTLSTLINSLQGLTSTSGVARA